MCVGGGGGCGRRFEKGFGILNTAQGIRNPSNDWNRESKFHRQGIPNQVLESGIRNPRRGIQNPRLTGFPYIGRKDRVQIQYRRRAFVRSFNAKHMT